MVKTVASVVMGLVVVACSGTSTTGGDGGGGGVSVQQACQDQSHARCTLLQSCSPERIQAQFGDEPTCEQRYTENCVTSLGAPSTGNSATITEGCSQAFASWACTDFLNDENIPPACAQVTGSIATGAACGFPGQCQSGFCAIAPDAACGVCDSPPAAGDSCAQLTTCGAGLVCTTDTFTCVVLAAQGASCGKGAPCGAGLSCVGANASKSIQGTCQTSVAQSGAACDPTGQTSAGCERNQLLTCNTQSKECAALTVAAGGQPCGTNDVNDQTALCSANGVCTGQGTGTPPTPGTCTAAAADGAACDTVNGPGCMLLSRCVVTSDAGTAGTCQLSSASCH
jgi:hypothetical protein